MPYSNITSTLQNVTSSTIGLAAVSGAAAAAGNMGGAVSEDDKCSVTSASAVPGHTPYSTETATTAASVGL
jgi:hypothetical protein